MKEKVKAILKWVDEKYNTKSYEKGEKLYMSCISIYRNGEILNKVRRVASPTFFKLKILVGIKKPPFKLHLGCGGKHFDGYVNSDFRATSGADMVCDARKLPFDDSSVAIIESYHFFEHIPKHDVTAMLTEWRRVLMPDGRGKLVIECPDFDALLNQYTEKGGEVGVDDILTHIFGGYRFPGDVHCFGYNFKRLKRLLEGMGFSGVTQKEATDSHILECPCLRVEGVK